LSYIENFDAAADNDNENEKYNNNICVNEARIMSFKTNSSHGVLQRGPGGPKILVRWATLQLASPIIACMFVNSQDN